MKKNVLGLDRFANRHPLLMNCIFGVSAIAFSMITSVDKIMYMVMHFISFSIILIVANQCFQFQRRFAAQTSYGTLIGCGIASALICAEATRVFYARWFQDVVRGGSSPSLIKSIYDRIPLSNELLNLSITIGCVVGGVLAVYALTVIMVLLVKLFSELKAKPIEGLLSAEGEQLSQKTRTTYRIIGFSLLAVMTLVMVAFSSAQSFWVDELSWTIGKVANKSIPEISAQLLRDGYNMPLYYYVLGIIYPIMPYGEGYLLSISIAAVVVGIVLLYFTARKIGGETLGFITLCLASVSAVLIDQGGWELRPYAFFFCFAALTVLFYIRRLKRESWGNIIGYGIAMILLLYSHWFGAVMLVFYGICDLYLCIKKRIRLRCIVSYVAAVLAALPWFILVLLTVKSDPGSYWAEIPSVLSPLLSIRYLLGGNMLCFFVFVIAVLIGLGVINRRRQPREWNLDEYIWVQLFLSCAWVIGVTFIYSKIINPAGSMYVNRYFFPLIPHALLITAFGIRGIGKMLSGALHVKSARLALCFAVFLAVVGITNYSSAILSNNRIFEPYREVAEALTEDGGIYEDESLVVLSTNTEAWLAYYFDKRGHEAPVNLAKGVKEPLQLVIDEGEPIEERAITFEQLLKYNRVYYSNVRGSGGDGELLSFLRQHYTKKAEDRRIGLVYYEK